MKCAMLILLALITLLPVAMAGQESAGLATSEPKGGRATAKVSFQVRADQIGVILGRNPLTTLHFGPQWAKPFLHPLRTADGMVITRGFPLEQIEGESNDHFWHRGLWYAHGNINGVDFWREKTSDPKQDALLPSLARTDTNHVQVLTFHPRP